MRYLLCISLLITCILLQGCFTAAGTAIAGGALIYKRKTVEHIISDQHIESEINNIYFQNGELWEQNRVIVSCLNGYVLLAGETRTAALKQKAESLIADVQGINRVYNEINVGVPVSIFRQSLDAIITIIIKTKMIFAQNFDPSNIKVVTNNGVVYLMGVVTPQQSDHAAAIASKTSGVKKVVKVFQYIT